MTKKVSKRGWSLDKFSDAVKAACERVGTRYSSTKVKAAYEDGFTVAYTASQMGNAKAAPKAATKKAA